MVLCSVPLRVGADSYPQCRNAEKGMYQCPGPISTTVLPVIPKTLGGFGASLVGLLTTLTEFNYVHGVTSAIQGQLDLLQPITANLTALLGLNSTGIPVRTGTNAWAQRSVAGGSGITVTNGDGVAGNPSVALTNASLTVAAGTGVLAAGCSPVSLGGTCTLSADYGTSGTTATVGNDVRLCPVGTASRLYYDNGTTCTGLANPPSGNYYLQASGSTLNWALTDASIVLKDAVQALTMKTLTAPAISSPAFSGTSTGTLTMVGLTLGANSAAGGFKWTGLGAPTAASSDAATASYAEAQKTGGLADIALLVGGITNGDYCGPDSAGEGCNATATAITSWSSPVAGTLKNCAIPWSVTVAPGDTNFTLYRAAGGVDAPTFATTTTVVPVGNGHHFGVDGGHTYAVIANDLFVVKTDRTWGNTKFRFVCQFIPTS